jgi:monoamine oxidase
MNNYNFSIIGGGISGLYFAYLLNNKYKKLKITILEKNKTLGGRISTSKFKKNNQIYQFEEGAGRFSDSHKQLWDLIDKFKLTPIKIPHTTEYISKKKLPDNYEKISIENSIKKIKKLNKNFLLNNTFEQSLSKYFNKNEIDYLINSFGYDSEFKTYSAYDTIRLFEQENFYNNDYYVLKEGLSSIVDNLKKELKNNGVIIKTNYIIQDIYKENNKFIIINNKNQKITSNNIVFATPPYSILQYPFIYDNFYKYLSLINPIPLIRIFIKVNKELMDKINSKIITDTNIRMILLINKEKNILQVYCDGNIANFWYNSYINGNLKNDLINNLEELFNVKVNLEILNVSYWSGGIHSFKLGTDSKKLYKKLINPIKNVYFINESYSLEQGWIEGSLEMANNVFQKIKI